MKFNSPLSQFMNKHKLVKSKHMLNHLSAEFLPKPNTNEKSKLANTIEHEENDLDDFIPKGIYKTKSTKSKYLTNLTKTSSNIVSKANQFSSMEIKLVEVNLDGKHQTSKHKNVDKVSKCVIQQNNTESRNRNLSTSSKRSLTRPGLKKCKQSSKQKLSTYLSKPPQNEVMQYNQENKFYDSQRSLSRNNSKTISKSNSKGSILLQSFKTRVEKNTNRLSKIHGKELAMSGGKVAKKTHISKQLPALPFEFKSTLSSLNMKIGHANEAFSGINSQLTSKASK